MMDLGSSYRLSLERSPDATALVDGALRLTYAEWFDKIRRVGGGLDRLGLKKGDRLVALMQNRWEMATLHWACQFQGLIITPLNWRVKAGELDYCLENADAAALVFQDVAEEAVANSSEAGSVQRIGLAAGENATATFDDMLEEDSFDAEPRADADDISVMLYTSGTTGKPKGVPRSHRAERAAALAHVAQHRGIAGEVMLGAMPFYHTMGVRSLLAMQLLDGRLICQRKFDPRETLEMIEKEKITSVFLVPTLFHDLLAEPAFDQFDISSAVHLGFAGAPMPDGLMFKIWEKMTPDQLVNHYGSSEIYTFTIEPHAAGKPGSAGKAGLNQRIRVVKLGTENPENMAEPGEEGQIIADQANEEAFTGYWRRPDADAKSFHDGWYFTGDTGFKDDDGDLFVTGRVDDMMISGGENITPVEIESVISLHPSVGEVAVAGIPDERWGQKVTAFIVCSGEVTVAELDTHCKISELADFKRPREYVFLKQIPKSPVGKILRRMLVAGEFELA
ncbi:MAG: AMP-binding protein [Rhodospirillales bacterium]|jgi:2-furoate---CoA ligase|nr:4-chlorobenzoate--CoA ligase [Rhodospirillaceae bacterium]MDP6429023.1 AMP-binding protein [Rhodospirillales bacterium]MDP6646744.1 AMP-binding protein [Rhodospirillales bacterium]